MGVRISWLTLAMNSLLAWLARTASSRVFTIETSSARRRVAQQHVANATIVLHSAAMAVPTPVAASTARRCAW